jgi:hypothetical protein
MTRIGRPIVLLASLAATYGCTRSAPRQAALPEVTPEVCAARPVIVDLTLGPGLFLNHQPFDSAAVARWISVYLPQFPAERRYLLIRMRGDSRLREAAWIAHAAGDVHAGVYRDDDRCQEIIPAS